MELLGAEQNILKHTHMGISIKVILMIKAMAIQKDSIMIGKDTSKL